MYCDLVHHIQEEGCTDYILCLLLEGAAWGCVMGCDISDLPDEYTTTLLVVYTPSIPFVVIRWFGGKLPKRQIVDII